MPGRNVLRNFFLSNLSIGCLLVRSASSTADGGGMLATSHRNIRRGKAKTAEATNGIQNSDTPQSRMRKPPTVLHNPPEKIKLTERAAPSTSVMRRPSIYPNTIPQTIPRGKPLANRKIRLYGGGTIAKKNHDNAAIVTIRRIPLALALACNSEMILIPTNFASP